MNPGTGCDASLILLEKFVIECRCIKTRVYYNIKSMTVQATKRNNSAVEMTAEYFIVATGERPRYPDVPGIEEFSITRYTTSFFRLLYLLTLKGG